MTSRDWVTCDGVDWLGQVPDCVCTCVYYGYSHGNYASVSVLLPWNNGTMTCPRWPWDKLIIKINLLNTVCNNVIVCLLFVFTDHMYILNWFDLILFVKRWERGITARRQRIPFQPSLFWLRVNAILTFVMSVVTCPQLNVTHGNLSTTSRDYLDVVHVVCHHGYRFKGNQSLTNVTAVCTANGNWSVADWVKASLQCLNPIIIIIIIIIITIVIIVGQ